MKKGYFGHVKKHPKNGQKPFWSCQKTPEKRAKWVLVVSKNGLKRAKTI
jgi:hypothetical protein